MMVTRLLAADSSPARMPRLFYINPEREKQTLMFEQLPRQNLKIRYLLFFHRVEEGQSEGLLGIFVKDISTCK